MSIELAASSLGASSTSRALPVTVGAVSAQPGSCPVRARAANRRTASWRLTSHTVMKAPSEYRRSWPNARAWQVKLQPLHRTRIHRPRQVAAVLVAAYNLADRHRRSCLQREDDEITFRDGVKKCPQLGLPVHQTLRAGVGIGLPQQPHQGLPGVLTRQVWQFGPANDRQIVS